MGRRDRLHSGRVTTIRSGVSPEDAPRRSRTTCFREKHQASERQDCTRNRWFRVHFLTIKVQSIKIGQTDSRRCAYFPEQSESKILLVAFSPELKVFARVRDIAGDERIPVIPEAEGRRCRLFYVDFEKSWSSRSKIPPSSALRAARMYLLVSNGSTLRRAAVAPSSMGHSR